MLEHKGVDYEYIGITFEQWVVKKGMGNGGEMGCLPIVHHQGV